MKSDSVLSNEDYRLTIVRRDEQGFAASAHLFAGIPIWGALFLCLLFYRFRQRSAEIVIHIQQAAFFMVIIYLIWVMKIVFDVILNVLKVIDADIATTLISWNNSMLYVFYGIHVIFCLTGILAVYLRRPFLYPIVGKYVLAGYINREMP